LAVAWFLYSVRAILFPFAIGLVVAALLDPSIRKLRMRGVRRGFAVGTMFAVFLGVVVGAAILVAPLAVTQFGNIQSATTEFIQTSLFPVTRIDQFLKDSDAVQRRDKLEDPFPIVAEDFGKWIGDPTKDDSYYDQFFAIESGRLLTYQLPITRQSLIDNLDTPIKPGWIDKMLAQYGSTLQKLNLPTTRSGLEEMFQVKKTVASLATGLFADAAGIVRYLTSSLFLLVLTPIITLLILLDYDNFRRRMVTWIPPAIRPAATGLMSDLADVLSAYVRGLTKSVLLYSLINAVILTVLGVPYSIFLGLLVGVFYLIPYIGNFISLVVIWLALATTDSNGFLFLHFSSKTTYVAIVLITFIVCGLLYDQLIHPRIVGHAVGLHPVVSFFVVLSGSALFGLPGMILAFPVAGMVKVILDRLIRYTTTTSADGLDLPRIPRRHTA
jgi:predicted PurR-regulated permease PerM